jgi:hypothetical protein
MVHHATGSKGLGVNLERCSDAAEHELGMVIDGITNLGFRAQYKYVKFVDAVTYLINKVVCMADADGYDVSNDATGGSALANNWPVGMVFQTVVPAQNQYGWVQIRGIASFVAGSASIIAGDPLKPDGSEDGDCDEATAGTDENIVGVAMATVADNATGLMMLAIRGG